MIAKEKHKSLSGSSLGYMLGVMLEKDQQVRIVGYNGFALSRMKIAELERIPTSKEEKKEHKLEVWKIANDLSKIFDARAALADYRVNDPFEDYIISFTDGERDRLRCIPTVEEREVYGLPKLTDGEIDERPLERIILEEFLARIGVHGKIEKTLRRKQDGKKYTTKKTVIRDAMYMAAAHDGTAHPHLHVFTARPDADGKVNDTRMERRRIVNATRELSKKYHLSLKLEGYEVDLEKTNEGYAAKNWARDNALWALETATSHEEFARKLNEGMTGVIPSWKVHSETGKEYGILFTKIDKRGNEHTWSGSQLDRRLSYGKVEEALARNLAERKAQEEADRQKAEAEAKAAAEKAAEEARIAALAAEKAAQKAQEEAARAAEEKDFIRRYVESDQAKGLLDFVNSGFDETHYSLVPGPLVETKTGMRLVLYTDGYRSPDDHNRILYHQHGSAPQDYGESYIDFSIDERGNLIAAIESDPTNRYTRGLTGKVNITTGEGTITIRKYRGSEKDEYCRLQERANFTDAENKQKPRRNTSYGPKL